jgi:hypothetical protein
MSEDELFSKKASNVYEIYSKILDLLKEMGPFEIEFKKTSIHILNKSSFGGVHPKSSFKRIISIDELVRERIFITN